MTSILKILDSNKKAVAFLNNIESGSVKRVVNGEYVLNFVALIEPLKTEFLYDDNNLIEYNNDFFKVISIEEEHNSDNMLKVYIECEHISYDLINQTKLTYNQTDKAALYVMNDLLLNSGFNFIGTDVYTTSSIDIEEETNIKNLLYQTAIIWGGELKYFQYDIELKQQLGQNRGADFRFGKNIQTIKRLINRVENTVSYEIEIVQGSELEELGYFELGDIIRVVDDMLGIEIETRIIETETDLVTGLNSKVILGKSIKDLSTGFSGIFDAINKTKIIAKNSNDKVNSVVDEWGNLIASKLTGTLNSAIETVEGQTGYVTFDQRGIVIHNQPIESESTWAILLSSGGILIANARESDGTWRWRTAITGDSISADEITTGTLSAINIHGVDIEGSTITGSTIKSVNTEGTRKIKLENGNLLFLDTDDTVSAELYYYTVDNNRGAFGFYPTKNSNVWLRSLNQSLELILETDTRTGVREEAAAITINPYMDDASIVAVSFGNSSDATKNKFTVVNGTKNCRIETEQFGDLDFSAYETVEILLGDLGNGEIKDGECIINLDEKLLACVNTNIPYQVFLTKYGQGDIWVEQRNSTNFIVKGDNIPFGYEVKVKRKKYENIRFGQTI